MAVNLPPHYHEAEAEYRKAQKPEDKLAALKKMWVILPKHKASEKVQAALKTKMADLADDIERKASVKKSSPTTFKIPRQGAGQFVIIGGPNGGKSSLLRKWTKATPEVAAYPFTTREPVPGMMDFEDLRFQLIELPAITADMCEPFVSDFVRRADVALLVVDMADDDGPFAIEPVVERLKSLKRHLVSEIPEAEDDPTNFYIPTLLVANKMDADGAADRLQIMQEMVGAPFPVFPISTESGEGLSELAKAMFAKLGIIRIFAKAQGKPVDKTQPYVIPIGGTVLDFAEAVHTDFAETLKSAKVWGSGLDGMTVKKDNVLNEGDIVQLDVG